VEKEERVRFIFIAINSLHWEVLMEETEGAEGI
jgi:hypothetical protein